MHDQGNQGLSVRSNGKSCAKTTLIGSVADTTQRSQSSDEIPSCLICLTTQGLAHPDELELEGDQPWGPEIMEPSLAAAEVDPAN